MHACTADVLFAHMQSAWLAIRVHGTMQQAEHPRSAGSLHAHLLLARLQVTPMHICDGIARPPKLAHARKAPGYLNHSVICRARLSGEAARAAGRLCFGAAGPPALACGSPSSCPPVPAASGSHAGLKPCGARRAFSFPTRAPGRGAARAAAKRPSCSTSRRPSSPQRRSARTAASTSQNLTVRRLARRACGPPRGARQRAMHLLSQRRHTLAWSGACRGMAWGQGSPPAPRLVSLRAAMQSASACMQQRLTLRAAPSACSAALEVGKRGCVPDGGAICKTQR